MKKQTLLSLVLTTIMLVGCGGVNNNSSQGNQGTSSSKVESPYGMKVSAVGSTTIKVTQTVTLRAQVTNTTQKDVT